MDPTYGLTYRLWLSNTGKTPAVIIRSDLTLRVQWGNRPGDVIERINEVPIGPFMSELLADDVDYRQSRASDILSLPAGLNEMQGSHYRKTGYPAGEDGSEWVEDCIEVSGTVTYEDVFGNSYTLHVD